MNTTIRMVALAALASAFSGTPAHGQMTHLPPPSASFVVGETAATGTVTVPGGRQIEVAGRLGGVIRLQVGTPRREVIRRIGNPLVTSILEKAGIIDFDSNGRLIRGPALEEGKAATGPVRRPG
ncbi:MAG: hypothetical protein ABIF09_18915 [Gemmatimonadota bacterium]